MRLYARTSGVNLSGQFAGNRELSGSLEEALKGGEMHHTKVKADIGVSKVIADLTLKGYVPCIPLSEHQPYDIVAVHHTGKVYKIQVKYASLKRNGIINVGHRCSWVDSHGTHIRHYTRNEFDYYAIYCPEKEVVLYVPNVSRCPKSIRFDKSANNQSHNVKWFHDYLKLNESPQRLYAARLK